MLARMGCAVIDIFTPSYWTMRAIQERERCHRRGFDWAAGELLRGSTVADVIDKVLGTSPFETGAFDACNTWEAMHRGN